MKLIRSFCAVNSLRVDWNCRKLEAESEGLETSGVQASEVQGRLWASFYEEKISACSLCSAEWRKDKSVRWWIEVNNRIINTWLQLHALRCVSQRPLAAAATSAVESFAVMNNLVTEHALWHFLRELVQRLQVKTNRNKRRKREGMNMDVHVCEELHEPASGGERWRTDETLWRALRRRRGEDKQEVQKTLHLL